MNINPKILNSLSREKDPQKLLDSLSDKDKQTVNKMLSDQKAMEEMLKSPQAQAILKMLSGKGKMDDLNEKLAGILNDPESMERVRKMAENLLGGKEEPEEKQNSSPNLDGFADGIDLGLLMNLVSKFNSSEENERTHLLHALKPYLSEKRQAKTENAIKILKLLELLPLLKDSGLLGL